MDKKDKEKKKAWKADQKLQARAAFPLEETELKGLFEFLQSGLNSHACDHTLRLTQQWIENTANSQDRVILWLEDNGGYCDCEVLANSYDHFMQNRIDA